jgi:hypothetical protein
MVYRKMFWLSISFALLEISVIRSVTVGENAAVFWSGVKWLTFDEAVTKASATRE